jgi:hypothetical protein
MFFPLTLGGQLAWHPAKSSLNGCCLLESVFVEPLYRFVDGENGEIVVYPDKVVFRARSSGSEDEWSTEISRRRLISVMNRRAPEEWAPDILVVLYRDEQGALGYFVWSFAEKNISRKVSDEIYKVIDNGFLKSVLAFFYVMTHPVKGAPWLYK